MRWDDIYLNAAAATLGRSETTADAVEQGRYGAAERDADGYLAVRVTDGDGGSAVEMAVDAAGRAVARAGVPGDEYGLLLHASIAHQGLEDFAPAPHLQRRTIGGRGTAMEVRQASNGGMAALEVAASFLAVRPDPGPVLVTTADRFVAPVWDRYRTAGGMVLGDGATALVVSRRPGVARLVSSVVLGDSRYEDLQVGRATWNDAPGAEGWPLVSQERVDGFVAERGEEVFLDLFSTMWGAERETVERALADAGATATDITRWVYPSMGESLTDWDVRKAYGVDLARTTWEWGREQGHLGAGDQFAALAHLFETRQVHPGDLVLLNGAGTGFSFSSAVVEILEVQEWGATC